MDERLLCAKPFPRLLHLFFQHISFEGLFARFCVRNGGSDGKASACNAGDPGSTAGSGRSSGEGNGTHSRIFAWKIPRTEEPGGLQSRGSQSVGHD